MTASGRKAFDTWRTIVETTDCPFAKSARLWPPFLSSATEPMGRRLDALASDLHQFVSAVTKARLHGYVALIESGGDFEPSALSQVAAAFNSCLRGLWTRDELRDHELWVDPTRVGWQFSFGGINLFQNVFAPCYPNSHSKNLRWADGFAIFMQPDVSFDYCGVNTSARRVKEDIRRRFATGGRPYSGKLVDARVEAHLYMFPLDVDDPPVEWWEARL